MAGPAAVIHIFNWPLLELLTRYTSSYGHIGRYSSTFFLCSSRTIRIFEDTSSWVSRWLSLSHICQGRKATLNGRHLPTFDIVALTECKPCVNLQTTPTYSVWLPLPHRMITPRA